MRHAIRWVAAAGLVIAAAGVGAFLLSAAVPVCRLPDVADTGWIERPADAAVDVADLSREFARIRQVAEQFSEEVARRPLLSDSPDALAGARTAPVRALAWCEDTLLNDLAHQHGRDVASLRGSYERLFRAAPASAAAPPAPVPQAVAVPASGTEASPAVVSRPSR